ncbi:hypothetical protein [Roseibacillus ishigakijimensis]|uniref:Uncharacterized protein n=1 Tax=Roseibacillus ishigakijimensis TaxID=454146 RepID=A0A934RMM2_9BACT|nr:hypothetical protein [Roseibacillus ishigakijimensis]MBK1834592.1 hypothetical protein [Roseibacillus ishigakijimensis]
MNPMSVPSFPKSAEPFSEVPLSADTPAFDAAAVQEEKKTAWWKRMLSAGKERRLREEKLTAELQELRVTYESLLDSADEFRERFDQEEKNRQLMAKVLSPFPAAVEGIATIQSHQVKAEESLSVLHESALQSARREETLLGNLDRVEGGVGQLQAGVEGIQTGVGQLQTGVNGVQVGMDRIAEVVAGIASGQQGTQASLGALGQQIDLRFQEAGEEARESARRMEKSSGDVLSVVRDLERNTQRGLWIFAGLLALLFVALLAFSAKVTALGAPAAPAETPAEVEATAAAAVEASSAGEEDAVVAEDYQF